MDVVLIHPDIPQNTGNVGRSCVATQTTLHLVGPMGFTLEDRWLKRAGLDYWKDLDVQTYPSLDVFLESPIAERPLFLFSRFAKKSFWDAKYPENAVLVFGSETEGLPSDFQKQYSSQIYRIPTPGPVRSLNLSTSVGVVLFEAYRQHGTLRSSHAE